MVRLVETQRSRRTFSYLRLTFYHRACRCVQASGGRTTSMFGSLFQNIFISKANTKEDKMLIGSILSWSWGCLRNGGCLDLSHWLSVSLLVS